MVDTFFAAVDESENEDKSSRPAKVAIFGGDEICESLNGSSSTGIRFSSISAILKTINGDRGDR